MDKEKIQKALEGIQREVPGCIMVGLAKFKDGSPIAYVNKNPNIDPLVAMKSGSRSVSTAMKAVQILNPKTQAEESLLTTEVIQFLIRMYPEKGAWFALGLTLDANLGMARIIIKKYFDQFYQEL